MRRFIVMWRNTCQCQACRDGSNGKNNSILTDEYDEYVKRPVPYYVKNGVVVDTKLKKVRQIGTPDLQVVVAALKLIE